jgi:hypothetical protein
VNFLSVRKNEITFMNEPPTEPQKPIPFDLPAAVKSLDATAAFLRRMEEQHKKHAETFTYQQPTTPTAHFNATAADAHRALKAFSAAIDNLFATAPLNNQLAHLLNTMKQDAERFQRNLEANALALTGEISGFNQLNTDTSPGKTDDNQKGDEP